MSSKKNSKLFLLNPDILVEEDPNITPVVVDCMSFVRERMQSNDVKLFHPFFGNPKIKTWPKKTDKDCLHCCHPFDTVPIPIPRRYDDRLNKYFVFGIFCSVNCAKAYILEHEPCISTTRMSYFMMMCRQVFGIRSPVKPAPPRIRLARFCGSLSIEDFRNNFTSVRSIVVEPPFIQNSLLITEQREKTDADSKSLIVPELNQVNSVSAFTSFNPSMSSSGNGLFAKFIQQSDKQKNQRMMEMHDSIRRAKRQKTKFKTSSSKKKGSLSAFITFKK